MKLFEITSTVAPTTFTPLKSAKDIGLQLKALETNTINVEEVFSTANSLKLQEGFKLFAVITNSFLQKK